MLKRIMALTPESSGFRCFFPFLQAGSKLLQQSENPLCCCGVCLPLIPPQEDAGSRSAEVREGGAQVERSVLVPYVFSHLRFCCVLSIWYTEIQTERVLLQFNWELLFHELVILTEFWLRGSFLFRCATCYYKAAILYR